MHINNLPGNSPFSVLSDDIVSCRRCPRLIQHCTAVAKVRRRAYLDQEYWGRPVPSFGDPGARLLILGLAPGAHGANRTGRVFTGDNSGDLLYRVLHATGFANRPESLWRGDGLELQGAYISCSAHCAPPDNRPSPRELRNCRPYLKRELALLTGLRVVVALGRIAFEVYLSVLQDAGRLAVLQDAGRLAVLQDAGKLIRRADFPFAHNRMHALDPIVITSYHPSRQNTSTGRLTERMLVDVFARAAELCEA